MLCKRGAPDQTQASHRLSNILSWKLEFFGFLLQMHEVPRGVTVPYLSLRQLGFYTSALNLIIIVHISPKGHQTVLMGRVFTAVLFYLITWCLLSLLYSERVWATYVFT